MRARTILIVAGLTLVAAVLRFWHIGARDIWTDEAISISIARLPWHEFRRVITNREANAAFYELLLKLWTALFGTSEAAVRSLSAVAGIATVPVLFVVARRTAGDWAGVAAAALITVNAYHVRYSQEARGYALATLLVVVATLCFLRMRETRGRIAAYVIWSVLAIYTHLFAVFVMAAHAVAACFDAPAVRKRSFGAIVLVAVFSAPLALFAKTKDVGQIAWIAPTSLHGVGEALSDLSGHDGYVLVLLFFVAVVFGAASLLRAEKGDRVTAALAVSWAVLPLLLALLVSVRKPIFLPRYLIVALPAMTLLAGTAVTVTGVRRASQRFVRVAVLGVLVGLSLRATTSFYAAPFDPPPQRWRQLVETISAQSTQSDAVIFYHPYMRLPFEYSRTRLRQDIAAPVLFPALANASMMVAPVREIDSKRLLPPNAGASHLASSARVWLIRSSPPDATSDALQSFLRRAFASESSANYGAGVDLFVYSRTARAR